MFRVVILVSLGGQNQKTNPKLRGTIPRDLLTTVADKVTKWDDPPYKILPPKKKNKNLRPSVAKIEALWPLGKTPH